MRNGTGDGGDVASGRIARPVFVVRTPGGALTSLAVVLVFGMSTWFSATAVVPQLEALWDLSSSAKAWLTISVQLGFVAGALVSAVLNLADLIHPRLVIFGGALGAAAANLALVAAPGVPVGIPLRFATGFFMAGVYPPAFKLVATWFSRGRGAALGVLAGSIILGNASPHLVNGLGGLDWRTVIVVTSLLSAVGGLVALTVGSGPHPFPRAVFAPRQAAHVFSNRGVRLASIGYFGHMWELFAMYAWFLVFMQDHLRERGMDPLPAAAFFTFAVMGIGAPASYAAGVLSDRWGRTRTSALMLAVSGSCALSIGFLYGGPTAPVVIVGLLWGGAVIADSAQFSAMVTEIADQSYVGTALTMQLAIGFTVTVVTIWLIPFLEAALTWRWAFTVLAIGPAIGIWSMLRLGSLPESAKLAGGRG